MTTKIPVELSSTPGIVDGSNATAITINSSEQVGIGTTSPSYKLTISSADEDHLRLENGSEIGIIRLTDAGILDLWTHGSDEITFTNGTGSGTERMRITSVGDVCIGGTNDVHTGSDIGPTLHILSETSGTDVSLHLHPDTGEYSLYAYNGYLAILDHTANTERVRLNDAGLVCIGDTAERSGNQDTIKALQVTGGEAVMGIKNETVTDASHRGMIIFTINDNSAQGRITCNNSATLFTSLSDYRLKEVLEPLPNGLDRLNQLKPVKFKWKKQGYNAEGFLAHEVAEIVPEAVSGKKDGEDMQSMDYGRITPLLVKAIQEQQEQIEQLKTEIQTLKGE